MIAGSGNAISEDGKRTTERKQNDDGENYLNKILTDLFGQEGEHISL